MPPFCVLELLCSCFGNSRLPNSIAVKQWGWNTGVALEATAGGSPRSLPSQERMRDRRLELPFSFSASGAPFPGIGADESSYRCWVYYRSIMRVAPNTYAGGSPRWKITHQLLGIPRECLVTPQRVAPRERGDPLRRVVPNTPILLSTAGVYFGIYFEFEGSPRVARLIQG